MGKVSGVVEVVGDVGGEGDDEVAAVGVGGAGEGAESVAGVAAFFEVGVDGLRAWSSVGR